MNSWELYIASYYCTCFMDMWSLLLFSKTNTRLTTKIERLERQLEESREREVDIRLKRSQTSDIRFVNFFFYPILLEKKLRYYYLHCPFIIYTMGKQSGSLKSPLPCENGVKKHWCISVPYCMISSPVRSTRRAIEVTPVVHVCVCVPVPITLR